LIFISPEGLVKPSARVGSWDVRANTASIARCSSFFSGPERSVVRLASVIRKAIAEASAARWSEPAKAKFAIGLSSSWLRKSAAWPSRL
jgi:hypothetical protein